MDTVTEARMAIEIGRLGGFGIIHRNFSIGDQIEQVKLAQKARVQFGAAVGPGTGFEEKVDALVKAGVKCLCVETANAFTGLGIKATKYIADKYPAIELISGNVATYEGAKALFEAGADALRVGMGPGSICTTRVMSGMGVPQLSAVVECARAAREAGKRVIADGGIKTSGDIVKALAGGASTVMLGSLLAGTAEAPGTVVQIDGKLYKSYRGMGSVAAMKMGSASRYGQKWSPGKTKDLVPEGVEGLVEDRGKLQDHLHQLVGGLKAGMSYLGAGTLDELYESARFIKITGSGLYESRPHSIVME
jgi:IMP dehydrogenase